MTDYRSIEMHIRRARLERSAVLGELIGTGIFAFWCHAKRLAIKASEKINALVVTPDEYSTAVPRRF